MMEFPSAVEHLPPASLITRQADLAQLVEHLLGEAIIAVDTESNSLYVYRERVCMLQFSTHQGDFLVDPLALKDLSPLAPVFASPGIEKVFHAAEYDVICLKRDFHFQFAGLFDTMIASRILGRAAFGLGDLLQSEFGVQIDKHFQRADWGQRPLPTGLLQYARLDTHYLIPLRQRLALELEAHGLQHLAQEDFERLASLEMNGRSEQPKALECWGLRGAGDLTPQQAAVLQELCRYRESKARSLDRPLFKVMNDQTLVAIAAACPATLSELGALPGMSRGQVERYGSQLLQAVQRGLKAQPLRQKRPPRPDEAYLERLERLRRWRKVTGEAMSVQSDVVLPRDLMEALARQNPVDDGALAAVMASAPWRRQKFGEQILVLLKGTI
jgi:ribonuclease D